METLDERVLKLEHRMIEVEARVTSNQLRVVSERQYVDANCGKVNQTLNKFDTPNENCGKLQKIRTVCRKSSIQLIQR